MTPEARVRQTIDALLTAAGWRVCDVGNADASQTAVWPDLVVIPPPMRKALPGL